jgi:hypothetical protein
LETLPEKYIMSLLDRNLFTAGLCCPKPAKDTGKVLLDIYWRAPAGLLPGADNLKTKLHFTKPLK